MLSHPRPDLHMQSPSLKQNISRLEDAAEELSQGGSDIGEEIRKLKEAESRRSSLASDLGLGASRLSSPGGAAPAAAPVPGGYERTRSRPSVAAIDTALRSVSYSGPAACNTQTSPGVFGFGSASASANRSRNASVASSYANSIVDVNNLARWGGYSPAAWVTSPTQSLRSAISTSGSWSHVSRQPSGGNRPTRFAAMPEPVQEGRPLDSPLALSFGRLSRRTSEQEMEEHEEDILRTEMEKEMEMGEHEEDVLGTEMERELAEPERFSLYEEQGHNHLMAGEEDNGQYQQTDTHHDYDQSYEDAFRPLSPAPSTDTFQQARTLFQDFDGVHYSPTTESIINQSRHISAETQALRYSSGETPRALRPVSYASQPPPPPSDNMVFYPAPVPRMLNLPKRLSQLPAAAVQAKRRSQVLNTIPIEARQSAPWLPQIPQLDFEANRGGEDHDGGEGEPLTKRISHQSGQTRNSTNSPPPVTESPQSQNRHSSYEPPNRHSFMSLPGNLSNIPPQLRASAFFDHPSVAHHNVEIKGESAVATLDSILAASATAPVSAFMDHPFAGRVGDEVFGKERVGKRHTIALDGGNVPGLERRKSKTLSISGIGGLLDRSKSSEQLALGMKKRNSVISLLTDLGGPSEGKKLRKRNSRMSLVTDLDHADAPTAAGSYEDDNEAVLHDAATTVLPQDDIDQPSSTPNAAEEEDDGQLDDDIQPTYAAPTTLLAELQLRKAQQKSRNRTAFTSAQGMHSTLLELDAVAQIEKKKRKGARVALAWEDPSLLGREGGEEADEDVPLGLLYPAGQVRLSKNGATRQGRDDWDRPLGLMARRELEDNEPLRARRDRLRGVSPNAAASRTNSQLHLAGLPTEGEMKGEEQEEAEAEDESEPLAQRLRRLKQRETLNAALGDLAKPSSNAASARNSTFADEILGDLGIGTGTSTPPPHASAFKDSDADNSIIKPVDTADPVTEPAAEEEETLGQRRARLQRERETGVATNNTTTATKAPLSRTNSLANLLSENPVNGKPNKRNGNNNGNTNANNNPKKDTHAPPEGTLLHLSAKAQERSKKKLADQMRRSSTMGLRGEVRPFVSVPSALSTPGGLAQGQQDYFAVQGAGMGMGMGGGAGTPGQMSQYGNGNGNLGSYQQQLPLMNPAAAVAAYGVSGQPQMGGHAAPPYGMQMQMPMPYAQGFPMPYGGVGAGMGGMQMPYGGVGMGMGGMQMQMYADPSMNQGQRQRELIDRWRLSIA